MRYLPLYLPPPCSVGPHGKHVDVGEDSGLGGVWVWALLQALAFMMALPLMIGLLMLLGWHVHLTLNNKTTIEWQEVRAHCPVTLSACCFMVLTK